MSLRRSLGRTGLALVVIAVAASCGDSTVVEAPKPQVAAIRIEPSSVKLGVGADSQLVAIVSDAVGTVIPGQDVRWNTLDGSILSVSPTGVVHGVSLGTAGVSAVTGQHATTVSVTVVAVGADRAP